VFANLDEEEIERDSVWEHPEDDERKEIEIQEDESIEHDSERT